VSDTIIRGFIERAEASDVGSSIRTRACLQKRDDAGCCRRPGTALLIFKFLAVLVCLCTAAAPSLGQGDRRVPVLSSYTVTMDHASVPRVEYNFIATEEAWKELWLRINRYEKAPKIDFARSFVLINGKDEADPNGLGISVIADSAGVVREEIFGTRIGYRKSRRTKLVFSEVSREGVTGILREDPALRRGVVVPLPH
jgi:hypothetical protein